MYQRPLVRYQQLLQQPAAWLQQQAIVRINPAGAPQYLVIRLGNEFKRGEYHQLRDLVERNVETFKSLVD